MQFRYGRALAWMTLVGLACTPSQMTQNDDGDGGGGGEQDQGGASGDGGDGPGGDGGNASNGGASGEDGVAGEGGQTAVPTDTPFLNKQANPDAWGPGFQVTVPAGVVLEPGGTQYLTSPKVAAKPLPAGSGISRTVQLLRSSTADKRNTVKILFYGQSITRQEWYVPVTATLKQMYPHADIQTWMLASGGQSADKMRRASAHDVIPLYPDLVIYQNYGGYDDVNGILADWRRQTTAEILIQNWHVGNDANNERVNRMAHLFIPDVARRLGAEFLDSRTAFRNEIQAKGLPNDGLTSDGIHLNEQGKALMAKLHEDVFKNHPSDAIVDPLAMVNTFEVGKDLGWSDGTLAFEFEGNRVDLIAKPGSAIVKDAATVLVDGKKPSEFPGNYAFTRPNGSDKMIDQPEPGWPWSLGAPMRIDSQAARVVEDWTLKISNRNGFSFSFSVEGSVTGPDGMGTSGSRFVSNSKRVVIEPSDWHVKNPQGAWNIATNQVVWKAVALSSDTYPEQAVAAGDGKSEAARTLFQGVPNGRHKVEIKTADGKPLPIAAVRTFRPPLAAQGN